jgi:hypothetical protein
MRFGAALHLRQPRHATFGLILDGLSQAASHLSFSQFFACHDQHVCMPSDYLQALFEWRDFIHLGETKVTKVPVY